MAFFLNKVTLMSNKQKSKTEKLYADSSSIGWIPCLSGKLNFAYASAGIGLNGQQCNIGLNDEERLIVTSSDVSWKDRAEKTADGDFSVIMSVSTCTADSISGDVYFHPKNNNSNSNYFLSKALKDFYLAADTHNAIAHYDIAHSYSGLLPSAKNDLLKTHSKLLDTLNLHSYVESELYKVSFVVERCGLTFLSYVPSPVFDGDNKETKQAAERQVFYYLKYALHTHKHHEHDDDAVSSICEANLLYEDAGSALIEQFSSSLVDLKRCNAMGKNKFDYSEYEGFISYSKALISACKNAGMVSDEVAKGFGEKMKIMQSSFSSNIDKTRDKALDKFSAQQYSRSFSALTLAILSLMMLSLFRVYGGFSTVSDVPLSPPVERVTAVQVVVGNVHGDYESFSMVSNVLPSPIDGVTTMQEGEGSFSVSSIGRATHDWVFSNIEYSLAILMAVLIGFYFFLFHYYTDYQYFKYRQFFRRLFQSGTEIGVIERGDFFLILAAGFVLLLTGITFILFWFLLELL